MAVMRLSLTLEETGGGAGYSTVQSIAETEFATMTYQLVTATTDQAIPFTMATGITTIDILLIQSDYEISWKQSASDTAATLDAGRVHLLWGTSLTALLLSNASGSTATVKLIIAGV